MVELLRIDPCSQRLQVTLGLRSGRRRLFDQRLRLGQPRVGTLDFLARVQPQAVVCSALGYGDPAEKLDAWEQSVAARGIVVFRQDRAGAMRLEIREAGFEIQARVSGQTFRSRAR